MRLALAAIERTANGTRAEIVEALRSTQDRASPLGTYSIDGTGDTTLVDYDVSRIHDCTSDRPERAVDREDLARAVRVLRQRSEFP